MIYFSNDYFFPIMQLALFCLLLWAFRRDSNRDGPGVVTRAETSMGMLERATGLAVLAIVTIVNKSVFDTKSWADYSAAINTFDLGAILYLCYFSRWGRNRIIGIIGSSNVEHH
jgi:hypothetical protein